MTHPDAKEEKAQRLLEALLFASAEPLSLDVLKDRLPPGVNVEKLLAGLSETYAPRGVNLVRSGDRWAFRTAADLAGEIKMETPENRRLSRAAMEVLAIIAYHQPATRAEIEEIRGVGLGRGTLDILLGAGWITPKGRRQTPGRPVTWVTTPAFLDHFGLESLEALPGEKDLRAAGLLDARPGVSAYASRAFSEELPLEDRLEDKTGE